MKHLKKILITYKNHIVVQFNIYTVNKTKNNININFILFLIIGKNWPSIKQCMTGIVSFKCFINIFLY